jgi:malonyl-CoA O-methyltransferase
MGVIRLAYHSGRLDRERRRAERWHMEYRGVFVTGTDTGVGKTVVSACLAAALRARYWKPVQTGTELGDDDTATVARLAALPADRVERPRYRLHAPLSPEAAGRREGVIPSLDDFCLPEGAGPLVVEGAGGVLVPLGGGAVMADLIRRLDLPSLLVARSTLGTINHTLLSVEALRRRHVPLLGVVMVGPDGAENADAIARHGDVRILAALPWVDRLDEATVAGLAESLSAMLPAWPWTRPAR